MWDRSMSAAEESQLTFNAEKETGIRYYDVMVDEIPDS